MKAGHVFSVIEGILCFLKLEAVFAKVLSLINTSRFQKENNS